MSSTTTNSPANQIPASQVNATDVFLVDQIQPGGAYGTRSVTAAQIAAGIGAQIDIPTPQNLTPGSGVTIADDVLSLVLATGLEFNEQGQVALTTPLANTGTFTKVTVGSDGRVTDAGSAGISDITGLSATSPAAQVLATPASAVGAPSLIALDGPHIAGALDGVALKLVGGKATVAAIDNATVLVAGEPLPLGVLVNSLAITGAPSVVYAGPAGAEGAATFQLLTGAHIESAVDGTSLVVASGKIALGDASAGTVTPAGGVNATLANLLSGDAPIPGLQIGGVKPFISAGTASLAYVAGLHYFAGDLDVSGQFQPNYMTQLLSAAPATAEQALGIWSRITNTSTTLAGNAVRIDYTSANVGSSTNFDLSLSVYMNPTGLSTTGTPYETVFFYGQSQYDAGTTGHSAFCTAELNASNLGQDLGWSNSRATQSWWVGVQQLVAERGFFGPGAGGGKDILFHLALVESGGVSPTTGRTMRAHNGILCEANFTSPVDGRGIYMAGDAVGSQESYTPLQISLPWLTGIRLDSASFADNNALVLGNTHQITWASKPATESETGTVSAVLSQAAGFLNISTPGSQAGIQLSAAGGILTIVAPETGGTVVIEAQGNAIAIQYSAPLHYFVGPMDFNGAINIAGGGLTIATGQTLKLGNAAVVQTKTSTRTVSVLDSSGAVIELLAA